MNTHENTNNKLTKAYETAIYNLYLLTQPNPSSRMKTKSPKKTNLEIRNSGTEKKILMALERIERKLDELRVRQPSLGAPLEWKPVHPVYPTPFPYPGPMCGTITSG